MEPFVQLTDNGDGSADLTITFADEDHRFSVGGNGETAFIEYEESLLPRGQIRVSEPDEFVYKELMQSDEMTGFLEANGYDTVKRKT